MALKTVLKSIKRHEGFESRPYIDPLVKKDPEAHGIPLDEFKIIEQHFDKLKVTFGYGFTYISEQEGIKVLEIRIKKIYSILSKKIEGFDNFPEVVQDVLVEMAYQIGWPTLLKFRKTLAYLQAGDYANAAVEMLDSRWARQTPNRAKELSDRIKTLA